MSFFRTAGLHHLSERLGKREPWTDEAVCASADPETWFPDAGRNDLVKAAKRVCWESCPVREECLEANLGERYGIYGGYTEDERRRIRIRRRRQGAA